MSHQNTPTGVPVVSPKVAPPRRAWATIPTPTPFRIQNPKLAAPSHPLDLNVWEAEIDSFVQRQSQLLLRADGSVRATMLASLRARMAALEDRTNVLATPPPAADPPTSVAQDSKRAWAIPAPEVFTLKPIQQVSDSEPEFLSNSNLRSQSDTEPNLVALKAEWLSSSQARMGAYDRFFRQHPDLVADHDATRDARNFKGWLSAPERTQNNPPTPGYRLGINLCRTHPALRHNTQTAVSWRRRVVGVAIEALDMHCWMIFATPDYRSMFADWADVRATAAIKEYSRRQVKADRMLVNQSSEIDRAFDILTKVHGQLPAPPNANADTDVTRDDLTAYDELVFNDPYQTFLAHMGSLKASKGGTPEFKQQMEKEEAERLEAARKNVEKELQQLQKLVAEKVQ
ncbi:hypothetical protein C8R47DRAFT_1216541 [Mycena vitilis]|nr:hypothetical protein C8R47DRAFT_1216541 [Mycena vitilis]